MLQKTATSTYAATPSQERSSFAGANTQVDTLLRECESRYDNGDFQGALEACLSALPRYRQEGDRLGEARTLNRLGMIYFVLFDYEQALVNYQQVLLIWQEIGNREEMAATLYNIGFVYRSQGRSEEALLMYEESLPIAHEVGDRMGEGQILNNIGSVYLDQRRFEEALVTFQEALVIRREVGDRVGEGTTLNNIGKTYETQWRYDEALALYQEALVIMREVGDQVREGTILSNIGSVYYSQGQYDEAVKIYQEVLAIHREMGNLAGEGETLNNFGLVYEAQGQYDEAVVIFEEALTISREVGDPAREGKILNNIGSVYNSQGRYRVALTISDEALTLAREVGDQLRVGTILNNIGSVYLHQGRYDEALEELYEAMAIAREVGDRAGEGAILNNIGLVHGYQGQYDEAFARFEDALAIHREVGDRAGECTTLNNIGTVYQSQGRYEEALTRYEEALVIVREVGDRADEGRALNNIGTVYQLIGRYEDALSKLEEALAIHREVGDRADEGRALNNIGMVYYSQGQYEVALTRYEEALAIVREIGNRAGEGAILNNIALIFKSQGQYEEAFTIYEEALAIHLEVGNRAGEGATLNNIGEVYLAQGRYEEALTRYEEALVIVREVGDRADEGRAFNNIGTVYHSIGQYEEALIWYEAALVIHREVGDQVGKGGGLNNIGAVYLAQGRYEEALTFHEEAIAVFESIRTVSGSDVARASFIAQYAYLYHRTLDLYVQENLLAEAFLVSEQGRARSFGDALATGSIQLSDNQAESLIAAELSSYNAVVAAKDALVQARALNPPDPKLIADLESQLEDTEAAHDESLAAIEARVDQLAVLVPGRKAVLSLLEVQDLLDEQSTLVSFWVLEERIIAFILTSSNFDVVSIDIPKETLNTQVKAFHDFTEIDSDHPDTATTLYNTLITPIRTYLNTSHLVIVPHQALHYVPFAALTDGEGYLMDEFAITYLPNASMLQFLPDLDEISTYDTAFILGNPVVGTADEFDNPLSNLPIAEQSAQTIAGLFGTTPLLMDAATETAVRQNAATANILHLGAHGRYNTITPMQSAIYLAPGDDETDVENNGRLRVGEVYGLPLENIELVVLSACETNLGHLDRNNPLSNISAGDEVVSLNRAFLFQSPTVISTLWTVDDTATGLLMEQFYTYLLDGSSKADALRLAQLDVREQYPNPYFWAGFVLSGDGGEIDFSSLPTSTSNNATDELITFTSEPTNPMQEATQPSKTAGNRICAGVALLLALVALVIGRKKKSYKRER